jgi:hypothetical protein
MDWNERERTAPEISVALKYRSKGVARTLANVDGDRRSFTRYAFSKQVRLSSDLAAGQSGG